MNGKASKAVGKLEELIYPISLISITLSLKQFGQAKNSIVSNVYQRKIKRKPTKLAMCTVQPWWLWVLPTHHDGSYLVMEMMISIMKSQDQTSFLLSVVNGKASKLNSLGRPRTQ